MGLPTRRLVSCTLAFFLIALPASADTFTVDDTGDGGDANHGDSACATSGGVCTLRAAIQEANALSGDDTIEFSIAGSGPHIIQPGSALPAITEPVLIQGDSEPDYSGSPVVVLDGQNAGDGVDGLTLSGFSGNNALVEGLSIVNFDGNGILLDDAGPALIYSSYIGVAADGSAAGNGGNGIEITNGASDITVGNGSSTGNVISNNGLRGIFIGTAGGEANNFVQGNLIGVDPSGTADMGNTYEGILTNGATGTTIGGSSAGDRNVISGNGRRGILIVGGDATIEGNYIGINSAGDAAIANSQDGIELQGGAAPVTVADNVVSGNSEHGIELAESGTTANIKGNYIGTDAGGGTAIPNGSHGILLGGLSAASTIGGTSTSATNVIVSGSGAQGISLFSDGNTVQGNYFNTNANGDGLGFGGGIRLGGDNNTIGGATAGAENIMAVGISGEGRTNVIKGNYIGTNPSGANLAGSTGVGINFFTTSESGSGSDNVIGETGAGEENVIAYFEKGIVAKAGFGDPPTGNSIRGNAIHNNSIGIDVGDDGVSTNDTDDSDTGPNRQQNFPEIQSASYDSGADEITVTYQVPSDPSLTGSGASVYDLTVDFYRADANGSGEAYLGSDTYSSTDYNNGPGKQITFTAAASVTRSDDIVATATDANGNTSEFSANAVQLPVELTAFAARAGGGTVQLTWTTASETNNAGFEVQRKTTDTEFQTLVFVDGAGTTSRPQRYAYEDASVSFERETVTYRLKQIDTDGTFAYSRAVDVALQPPATFALQSSFPNPAHEQATIRYALPRPADVQLVVYDVLGRRVRTLVSGAQSAGCHEATLQTSRLPSGVYVYRLRAGEHVETRQLTVVR